MAHDHHHHHDHDHELPPQHNEIDHGNIELANALRRSFGILKLVMLVLVVLYFLSGWYRVPPGEAAVVYRFGKIVDGAGTPVNTKGWGWSWPYPIDRVERVSIMERIIPVDFMLNLTDNEKATGNIQAKFGPLSPERDDYLVTGDANILHGSFKVQYRITEDGVIDYLSNVYDMPREARDAASVRPEYERYPEYTLLTNLARNSVIETAAKWPALSIRSVQQEAFLNAVQQTLSAKLEHLASAGTSIGIRLRDNGVIAAKSQSLEAVLPPRQTQEAFEAVFKAETRKAQQLAKARSNREARLIQTAGTNYEEIADAIDSEFQLLLKVAAAKDGASSELKEKLDAQSKRVNELLALASGDVRTIINDAEIEKQKIVEYVKGDDERLRAVLPEYQKNPLLFLSRRTEEIVGLALTRSGVTKMYVPPGKQIRLQIPRDDTKGAKDPSKAFDPERVNTDDIEVRPSVNFR